MSYLCLAYCVCDNNDNIQTFPFNISRQLYKKLKDNKSLILSGKNNLSSFQDPLMTSVDYDIIKYNNGQRQIFMFDDGDMNFNISYNGFDKINEMKLYAIDVGDELINGSTNKDVLDRIENLIKNLESDNLKENEIINNGSDGVDNPIFEQQVTLEEFGGAQETVINSCLPTKLNNSIDEIFFDNFIDIKLKNKIETNLKE
jgi:hypothetical protein